MPPPSLSLSLVPRLRCTAPEIALLFLHRSAARLDKGCCGNRGAGESLAALYLARRRARAEDGGGGKIKKKREEKTCARSRWARAEGGGRGVVWIFSGGGFFRFGRLVSLN